MKDVYQEVTSMMLQKLSLQVIPWAIPYRIDGTYPTNLVTRKVYHGWNVFMLGAAQHFGRFSSPYWVGYKQVQSIGGHVKKGQQGTTVIFYKLLTVGEDEEIPFIRSSHVWNIDQCEIPAEHMPQKPQPIDHDPIVAAERLLEAMKPRLPEIVYQDGHVPSYNPSLDQIVMPPITGFVSAHEYYSTLYHEATHSTLHATRVGRKFSGDMRSETYSFEELIAEMGAAFLASEAGIVAQTISNSASYIKHWYQRLKENPTWIIKAATQAQKTADFLLSRGREAEDPEELAA